MFAYQAGTLSGSDAYAATAADGRLMMMLVETSIVCRAVLHRANDRRVDHVLGDEPDLQLVPADDATHEEIVGPIVARSRRALGHRARFLEDDLVRVQQPG